MLLNLIHFQLKEENRAIDYVVFDVGMAGEFTTVMGPYDEVTVNADITDTPAKGEANLWEDDTDRHHVVGTAGGGNTDIIYDFNVGITESDLFEELVDIELEVIHEASGGYSLLVLMETLDAVTAWGIGGLRNETSGAKVRTIIPISNSVFLSMVDADGKIAFRTTMLDDSVNNNDYSIYTLLLHVKCKTTLDEGFYEITDTLDKRLKIDTDLTIDGVGIWERCPYSVHSLAYTHINGLVTDNDILENMTTDIETTSSVLGVQFTDSTALSMISQIARGDKAVWWVPLGTEELKYKSTFTDGAPAEMTDADVLHWSGGEYDYEPMFNEVIVYGERTQTATVRVKTSGYAPDPGDTSQAKYDIHKSRIVKQAGIKTHKEALELGRTLVERDEYVNLFLSCTIAGWSSFELGDEVNINSTLLSLTNQKYVVTHFAFDSPNYRTVLRLHPRSSDGYVDHLIFSDQFFYTKSSVEYISDTRDLWKQPGDDAD